MHLCNQLIRSVKSVTFFVRKVALQCQPSYIRPPTQRYASATHGNREFPKSGTHCHLEEINRLIFTGSLIQGAVNH